MRRLLAALLIPLAIVLPAVAAWSAWGYAQATDRSAVSGRAAALADDRAVQRMIADQLIAALEADLSGLRLPGDAAAVRAQVRAVAEEVAASAPARAALRATLRPTYAQMTDRLSGRSVGAVTLDLSRLTSLVRARLRAAGLGVVAGAISAPAPIVVADRAQVRRARHGVRIAHTVRAITLPAAVLALLGVAATARRRWGAAARPALCLAGALAVGALAWVIVRSTLHDDVAVAIYEVLSRSLRGWAVGGAVAAAVLAALAGALATAQHRAGRAARHPWPLPRP